MKKYTLEATVFLSGALTMVLELIAARILSPYVGSSNLIWTAIIGVMLTSMSIGYWIGGKKADENKENDKGILAGYLLIAGIATSFIPIMETVIVNNLAEMVPQLIIVAIISSAIVFGIPSFLLATVSPMAVKLKNNDTNNIGETSGKISSLSTIGSIFGTFFAGFVLIPNIGVRSIIFGVSILLWILSFLLFSNKNKKYYIFMIVELIMIIGCNIIGNYIFKIREPQIIRDVDSEYSRIWVKEIQGENESYKTLQVDTGLESYINQTTGEMGSRYLTYFDLFEYYNRDAEHTLMIGGAAYTYPMHYLKKYQDKKIDVVEIDEKMTQLSKEEFDLNTENPNLKIYTKDGRSFLNYNKDTKYDAILIDAFKGLNAPFELTTYEAMKKAYNNLNENGIVITNIISALEGKDTKFIEYEYNTYKAVFDDVKLFKVKEERAKQERQNLILMGIKGNTNINNEKQEEYQELLSSEIQDFKSDRQIVTDNFAPIGN